MGFPALWLVVVPPQRDSRWKRADALFIRRHIQKCLEFTVSSENCQTISEKKEPFFFLYLDFPIHLLKHEI